MAFLKSTAAVTFGLLGLLAVCCAGACLVSPATAWWCELFALTWPVVFIACSTSLLLGLIIRRSKVLWLLVPGTVAGVFHVPAFVQVGGDPQNAAPPNSIKVMTYNVRLFDFYGWSGNAGSGERIVELIEQEQADVLCLQEFSTTPDAHYTHLDSLRMRFGLPHVRTVFVDTTRDGHFWGMAIFSRYPIAASGQVELGRTANAVQFADLVIDQGTVRVYNVHLQSNRFKEADRHVFEDQHRMEERLNGALFRFAKAARIRAGQALTLKDHMERSPHPVFLCGDLNDPPATYVYRTLCSGLRDAFAESGTGVGYTYHGLFPAARIDHILHDERWQAHGHRTVAQNGSDHDPVVCHLNRIGQ